MMLKSVMLGGVHYVFVDPSLDRLPRSGRQYLRALTAEASAVDLAGTFSLESGDRILFFTGTHCAGCDAVLERMLARIHQVSGLDLYLVDVSSGEESRIREWAAARQIDPQWVREHRITLNIDAGALERVLAHTGRSDADLPVLVRKRGGRLTPLPKSRF